MEAGQQRLFRFGRVLALVLVVELAEEFAAFAVGEAGQVFGAARIVGIGQQRRRRTRQLEHVVAHHVAHQAHEHQVGRVAQRLAHGQDPRVVEFAEVAEVVQAAAGEEAFARIARVLALHRRRQHRRQAAVGARFQALEVFDAPQRHAVLRIDHDLFQFGRRHRLEALVQLVDDVHVGDQGAQLGRRAQVQLGAFVDVERLVVVVGLDAQVVGVRAALHQREAVHHVGRIAVAQHALAGQAGGLGRFGVAQAAQLGGDGLLRFRVEGAGHRQVEPVEVVQARVAEQAGQVGAHRVRRLAGDEGVGRRRRDAGARCRMQLLLGWPGRARPA